MKVVARVSVRSKRTLALLLLLCCGGCQFLQNEFFFLDREGPAPVTAADHANH